jgi:cytochrome c oxidase accessory protein FixG
MCVQVCPTGIDIRHGLQYQCIGCAACIDVCDDVMERMEYPKGLIRYTTENAIAGKPTHVLRPRVFVYATILITLFGGLAYAVSQRVPLELDIIRDRANLYRETPEGLIENVYEVKIINMDERDHVYRLAAGGLEGVTLIAPQPELRVPAGEVYSLPIQIRLDPAHLKGVSADVTVTLASVDDPSLIRTEKTRFMGPRI